MQLTIKTNFPQLQKKLNQLRADVAERATVSAINRTLALGNTQMVRAITETYNIKASTVRESLRIQRASYKSGRFMIEGFLESPSKRGRSRNLIHFDAKQTRQGVSVKIKRGGPRKLIRGAFIANKGNAYGGTVFIRRGDRRLPIDAKQTIAVSQMFNSLKVNRRVTDLIQQRFPDVFEREVRFYTDRFNRTGA